MAAFYSLPKWLFYRLADAVRGNRFAIRLPRLHVHPQFEAVVHRASQVLLAAEIPLGRLYRCMPQQELNLLQLTTTVVAQLRASSSQVVWRNVLQAHSLATSPDHIPDHILRNTIPPYLPRPGNRAKDLSLRDSGRQHPLIERRFDPSWNGDGADMPALADQIHHRPVSLAHLDLIYLQSYQFRSAKTTTKEHRQHGIVSLRSHAVPGSML